MGGIKAMMLLSGTHRCLVLGARTDPADLDCCVVHVVDSDAGICVFETATSV